MKTSRLTTTFALTLGLLLAVCIPQFSAAGQGENKGEAKKLEGTWVVDVTLRNCQTGDAIRSFQGLTTFVRGGQMLETANASSPALRSPGHGTWRGSHGQRYTSAFMFFRFNPDGTYAGTQKVTGNAEIGENPDEFNGTSTIEIFNPAGGLVATACVTQKGRRFE